ncbi:MAG: dipeptidase [Deferrisomatales bacterium]
MDRVLAELERGWDEALEELFAFLRIPSVSADPAFAGRVAECAGWLAERFAAAGLEASVEPTGGHPAVVAQWRGAPGAPTVLVYGHYDVQPADPADGWGSPPFEPTLRGGRLVARGASDDKGQLYAHLLGARAHLRARGSLPVNVVFLVEGEEEAGSEHLEGFLVRHRERFGCDAVVISDSAQFAAGVPAITYGLRGLVYLEVTVRGPGRDLHSGSFGGAVRNPAEALAAMLGALHDGAGRVAVPGFYDAVRPLEPWEREAFAGLPFDEEAYRRALDVPALWGETGYSPLERVWARPALDINGLIAGYTGRGAKTVLPREARAKLSCRLVPDQDPQAVGDLLEAHLRRLCPPECTVSVERLHGARPVLLPVDAPAVRAAAEAVERGFGRPPVFIREGGSIPVVEGFQRLLGAPVVLLGFGRPDDGAHGPDERLHLEDLQAGARTSAWLWEALGGPSG